MLRRRHIPRVRHVARVPIPKHPGPILPARLHTAATAGKEVDNILNWEKRTHQVWSQWQDEIL